jgi:hypothetical protein
VPRLSPTKRWQIRAVRHLVIQTAGFLIGVIIAVVCASNGNWIEAGVVAFIAMYPGTMALIVFHKMRSVARREKVRVGATPSD